MCQYGGGSSKSEASSPEDDTEAGEGLRSLEFESCLEIFVVAAAVIWDKLCVL